MPHLRRFVVTVGLVCLAATGIAAPAAASTSTAPDQCSTAYFDGDSRLGPQVLPRVGPVARELRAYRRFGGLTEQKFLATYWDPAANGGKGGKGGWRYPPADGFLLGPDGRPIEWTSQLPAGLDIDRYGSEYGAFLAPAGTLYKQRAIPPQSLDVYDPNYACNYHDYQVLKPFSVLAGPIAPAFAQAGGGLQFQLQSSLVPGGPARLTVLWLVENGYLKRLNYTPPANPDYTDGW